MASLDPILGPVLMGTIFNVLLYGIMIMQCYVYFQRFKQDRREIKAVVYVLLLLDTMTCGFDIAMAYNYLVTNFGNFSALAEMNLGLRPYPVTTAVTAFIVQCFFGWRILVISGNRMLSILVYTLSTVQLLGAIGATIGGSILRKFTLLEKVNALSLVWLIGSLVTDVVITCALVWYLRRVRTGFSSTDDMISRLIRLTIQTGLLTTSCAIAVFTAFFASRASLIHIAFGLPLSKLYTNSLLSTLNSRQGWTPLGDNADDRLSSTERNRSNTLSTVIAVGTFVGSPRIHLGTSMNVSPTVSETHDFSGSGLGRWQQDKAVLV